MANPSEGLPRDARPLLRHPAAGGTSFMRCFLYIVYKSSDSPMAGGF